MLSCPHCHNTLEFHERKVTFATVEGWKCSVCGSVYRAKELFKSILTRWFSFSVNSMCVSHHNDEVQWGRPDSAGRLSIWHVAQSKTCQTRMTL